MRNSIFILVIFATSLIQAATIHIPYDYFLIQAGINAAATGDTILVSPGTYTENLDYSGKNLVIGSLFLITGNSDYIDQTVIDGNQAGSVVRIASGEDIRAVLCGFTLINGLAARGGGIHCQNADPVLKYLVILNNTALDGGGVYCKYSDAHMEALHIEGNLSSDRGGAGIYCGIGEPYLKHITIVNNESASRAGGIYISSADLTMEQTLIAGNTAGSDGGGIYCATSDPVFNQLTLFGNSTNGDGPAIAISGTSLILVNSILWDHPIPAVFFCDT